MGFSLLLPSILEDKVDLLVMGDDTPYELRFRIFRNGIIIIIKDKKLFRMYRSKSISLFLDFKIFEMKLRVKEKYIEKLRRLAFG